MARLSKDISIHTPARGVTEMYQVVSPDARISIHTPARGVTLEEMISARDI